MRLSSINIGSLSLLLFFHRLAGATWPSFMVLFTDVNVKLYIEEKNLSICTNPYQCNKQSRMKPTGIVWMFDLSSLNKQSTQGHIK